MSTAGWLLVPCPDTELEGPLIDFQGDTQAVVLQLADWGRRSARAMLHEVNHLHADGAGGQEGLVRQPGCQQIADHLRPQKIVLHREIDHGATRDPFESSFCSENIDKIFASGQC